MTEDVSIAHEFYKVRNAWKGIALQKWDMAIWVCDYRDIDIIDKFFEIEASPIGMFDDIFFKIQTPYTNDATFEKQIWEEVVAWFSIPEDSKYDLIGAMKKDGYLDNAYNINKSLPANFDSVITELLRLKKLLKYNDENFICYFPPGLHETGFQNWFNERLEKGLPKGIRFASIDPAEKRVFNKLSSHKTATVRELSVALNMGAAMKNAMDKDSDQHRPHTPSARFQKQIRKIMEATTNEELSVQEESDALIKLGYQLNMLTSKSTAHLVSAIAFFSQKEDEEALYQVEKTIELTEAEIEAEQEAYPLWRSAIMLKGALLLAKKKKEQALHCYQDVGDKAALKADAFYAMEAYRMKAFIYFKNKKYDAAWEAVIFSLQAGTNLPLEVRRGSTFLYSAAMAYKIAQDDNHTEETLVDLEQRFEEQIGNDWDTLLQGTDTIDVKYMNRKNWFKNFSTLLK